MLLQTVTLLGSIISAQIPAKVIALGCVPHDSIGCPTDSQIQMELGHRLSNKAALSVATSPEWNQLLLRASSPRIRPGFVASVEPATEEDVQEAASPVSAALASDQKKQNRR